MGTTNIESSASQSVRTTEAPTTIGSRTVMTIYTQQGIRDSSHKAFTAMQRLNNQVFAKTDRYNTATKL
jgi:hypothetical protein